MRKESTRTTWRQQSGSNAKSSSYKMTYQQVMDSKAQTMPNSTSFVVQVCGQETSSERIFREEKKRLKLRINIMSTSITDPTTELSLGFEHCLQTECYAII